ncbi:porin [Mariniflexile litorale]|uniref:Porin n=1 Tax=Mariniflexile litorale TaxID=3045158 RepID=A0AAU7EHC0_9FLAO|nr:porin [Mariniflexile sp. KMM 9835]MDQ8211979.1 porin [Mariniflexile sp. KMM 9835]
MKSGMVFYLTFIIALSYNSGFSQDDKALEFHLLGQDDDGSFLSEQKHKSAYESFKWIDLGDENSLSFGGGYRFQIENFVNQDFSNQDNEDNIWYLNRFLLHSHLKLGNQFELYSELSSSTTINKKDLAPVDKDELSINQVFVKYHFNSHWSFLLGRENLKFGSRRLIDIREGPNVRRSFDLARLDYTTQNTQVTTFFSIPVQLQPKVFDNDFLNFNETFSGVYATKSFNKSLNIDLYGFYQKDNSVNYNSGLANERRYTLGTRYFGTINSFTFNNEMAYQFGQFGEQNIRAYTLSLQGEVAFNFLADKSVLGLKTEIISGDKNSNDTTLKTFDALYPRGAYFGKVAKFGPSNLIDVHPYINVKKGNCYVELDYDVFWRYSVSDGVYGASLLLDFPSTNNKAFIAQQIGTLLGYDINNHFNIEFETNIIFPGDFLKNSNLSATLFHAVITTEFKF